MLRQVIWLLVVLAKWPAAIIDQLDDREVSHSMLLHAQDLEASLSAALEGQQKDLTYSHRAGYALWPSYLRGRPLRTKQLGTKAFQYCSPPGSQCRIGPHVE